MVSTFSFVDLCAVWIFMISMYHVNQKTSKSLLRNTEENVIVSVANANQPGAQGALWPVLGSAHLQSRASGHGRRLLGAHESHWTLTGRLGASVLPGVPRI